MAEFSAGFSNFAHRSPSLSAPGAGGGGGGGLITKKFGPLMYIVQFQLLFGMVFFFCCMYERELFWETVLSLQLQEAFYRSSNIRP